MSTYDWKILYSTINRGNTAIYKPLTRQSTANKARQKRTRQNKKEQGKTRKNKTKQEKTRKNKKKQEKTRKNKEEQAYMNVKTFLKNPHKVLISETLCE